MFKKVLLAIVLVLCMTVSAIAGCIIPQGTTVWVFLPGGQMQECIVMQDREVELFEQQPDQKALESFSTQIGQDWTDAKAVIDTENNVLSIIHEGDLKCSEDPQ